MRPTRSLKRLWQIRRVIKKHHLAELLDDLKLPSRARLAIRILFGGRQSSTLPRGERVRRALESLGPVFIKFGQALSTRPDILPADIATELAKLQDRVPPFPGEQAMQIIRDSYGDETDQIFASIDTEPLASASVAQVHSATLQAGIAQQGKNGKYSEKVIIKILRPGVEQAIDNDLRLMYRLARWLQRYSPRAEQFKPLEVIKEYENTIRGELDLRQEAANCSQMGANFEHTDIIYVPLVYWDYTQRSILVMERIYGTSVREIDKLKALGYDLKQLASDGVTTFFKQAFEDNFFHADMHPGNIFVCDKGRWIAIDFGIMGVLNESDKRYLAEMLLGFFNRDYRTIAQSHFRAGWVPAQTQLTEFENAIRMVCEPNFAKPIAEISFGKVLMELVRTVQRFEMPVQPQLVLLYKTLFQIEGLGRQLYPQLNLWDTAKPFLENWMKQQLSPQALLSDLRRDWPRWRAVLADMPDHIQRLQAQSADEARRLTSLDQQAKELKKSRRAGFHRTLGFSMAITAFATSLATNSGYLNDSFVSQWALPIGLAGLIWAFVVSR